MKCPVFKEFGHVIVPVISKRGYVLLKTRINNKADDETLSPMDSNDLRKIANYMDYLKEEK